MELDGVTDAFCGTSTVIHLAADAELDAEAVKKILKDKKVKVKGELREDASQVI